MFNTSIINFTFFGKLAVLKENNSITSHRDLQNLWSKIIFAFHLATINRNLILRINFVIVTWRLVLK